MIRVTPADVSRFLDGLSVASPTRKLLLAGLRRFFDALVLRQVLILNPTLSVRSERYQVVEGKTPEMSFEHARRLLRSIDNSHDVGLRDFVVIAILIYTAARIGAVARLKRRDDYESGDQSCLRFHETGDKVREIPVRHDLQQALERYLDSSGLRYGEPNARLSRSAVRRTRRMTQNGMTADDMVRMVNRRSKHAGLSMRLSPQSFLVTTITDLLEQAVSPADRQYLAGHADPRATRLYDRRQRRVTKNIIVRISV